MLARFPSLLRSVPLSPRFPRNLGTFRGLASAAPSPSSLWVCEHIKGAPSSSSLSALTAASRLSQPITALVAGPGASEAAASLASLEPVSKVVVVGDEAYNHGLPEVWAPLVAQLTKDQGFSHVFAAHSAFGRNVMPRVAATLDVSQLSDITSVESEDTFTRPIYAGNIISTVQSSDPIKILTVRSTAFPSAVPSGGKEAEKADGPQIDTAKSSALSKWLSEEIAKSDRPELGSAKRVISGGRALGSKDNFKLLEQLADKLGAGLGASRAAVDAGYVDNALQVGQTGKIVAPELYVAIGISGAIQHLAGMKDSKVIVAINKDAEAPIFAIADYGLVGDLFKIVPELAEKL
ncbi:hypothetical protein BJ684DRAFT_7001 [Piptocephalis cylindrospora]|uniref:Probable electron transfer flavoprotein subunit alpha n=1 Tax=Piptocephalis cylindrospora TaxID=1907219 RepID=A0A4P9Y8K9_9FUNG|nr:hypothetical protein BJ684DRAFT_7001 [Piptocephalis cylindrospora]|eukprot:RKP15433.1 hypothetical protein BJ684DRAFT_7001 [Piptocephalis cylindrospora]